MIWDGNELSFQGKEIDFKERRFHVSAPYVVDKGMAKK
jgi:hypothetical protein